MAQRSRLFVFDIETTGFAAKKNDRVVELGFVELGSDLERIGEWSTLVNPQRDAGPKHIHAIESKWLMDAPTFAEIAQPLHALIADSILVAHNASFDVGFLRAEFARVGIDWEPAADKLLDTMSLAKWVLGETSSLKLGDLCADLEIENSSAHSALADSIATAELLAKLALQEKQVLELIKSGVREPDAENSGFQDLETISRKRPSSRESASNRGFVPTLVAALPLAGTMAPDALEYVAAIHKAFEDFVLTSQEINDLTSLAKDLGLSLTDAVRIHQDFFRALAEQAWADDLLTDKEWEQLEKVGEALGLSPIELELAKTGRGFRAEGITNDLPLGLHPGDCVVLTGDMIPSKAEVTLLLHTAGVEVKGNISKKIRLVIAADADSLSGKAAAARKLGITVISVDMFSSQWPSAS